MMRKLLYWVSCVFFLAAALPDATAQNVDNYRIGPKDLVEIRVFEAPNLNSEHRVSTDGDINFPPVGDVSVLGLTAAQLEARLKERLEERFFQRASVSVQLREYRSKPISVIGAVTKPGDLGFSGRWTLLEALTAAGGLAENHGTVIYVRRQAENGLSSQVEIAVDDLMVRADPKVNIPIFANDLINVSAAVDVTVYCLGAVERPGALTFKSSERVSLLAAIARAGGLTDRASPKIVVKRAGQTHDSTGQEIGVDYKRIVAGKEEDFRLREGDVVVVKESFF
ncbi:MAG: polysaccharide export protein [Deltaproteobacteria bacterium]|nr:polysaccharide export protein [Deltaproteobacteria bacterium]